MNQTELWKVKAHIATSEVTSLKHEFGNHSVELGSLVSEAILSGAEMLEIPAAVGGILVVEFEIDPTGLVCLERQPEFQDQRRIPVDGVK